jgi:hypothetical protein
VTWERDYDPEFGTARAITRLAQGGFMIAGEVQRSAMEYQASLLHIDAAGDIVGAASLGPRGLTGSTLSKPARRRLDRQENRRDRVPIEWGRSRPLNGRAIR